MDARPQRPLRTLRVRADENRLPLLPNGCGNAKSDASLSQSKPAVAQQRNRSTSALSSLSGNVPATTTVAGKGLTLKRTAFSDVSNTVGNVAARQSKDDSSISASSLSTLAERDEKKGFAPRPAQRGKVPTTTTIPVSSSTTTKPPIPSKSAARQTCIYRDVEIEQTKTEHAEREIKRGRENGAVNHGLVHAQYEHNYAPVNGPDTIHEDKEEASDTDISGETAYGDDIDDNETLPDEQFQDAHAEDYVSAITEPTGIDVDGATEEEVADDEDEYYDAPQAVQPPVDVKGADRPQHVVPEVPLDNIGTAVTTDSGSSRNGQDGYTDRRTYTKAVPKDASMVVYPEVTERTQREIAAARQIVETTMQPELEDDHWDISMVAEYGDEIFDYMRETELKLLPNPHYMDKQTEIQWSMRSVLIDWIVQVHTRFALLPETLFLTVNYIDRFLSCKIVSLGKLQLVGATAIFIASKYEEVTCPSLQEILYMVDHMYSSEEILKAERFMLAMLQFELGWPGPLSFLRRINKADGFDYDTRTLAKYFLEVTIMDERFVGAPASFLAAASHCLARMMLRKGKWTPAHIHYSGYTYAQLHPVMLLLLDCVEHARRHHATVHEKYSHRRVRRASCFVEGEMSRGFRIPDPSNDDSILPRDSFKELHCEKHMTDFSHARAVAAQH